MKVDYETKLLLDKIEELKSIEIELLKKINLMEEYIHSDEKDYMSYEGWLECKLVNK